MNTIFELNEKEMTQMNGARCGGRNNTCNFNENFNINRNFGFSRPCDFGGGFPGPCGFGSGFGCFGGCGFERCDCDFECCGCGGCCW
ncbi:MAG TPA: hypothetical protein VHZ51_30480 [Ktedonobacteraceae bacterium]|nr:hypothetical protein [Ktedonobacteraceae bacterium]